MARRLDACRSQAAVALMQEIKSTTREKSAHLVCRRALFCPFMHRLAVTRTHAYTLYDTILLISSHLLDLELDWIGEEQGGRVNHEWRRLRKRTARLLAPCGTARGNGDSL